MFQLTFWSVPPIAALALAWHTLARARTLTETPGLKGLRWLSWCVTFWASGQLIGTLTTDLDLKIIAAKVQYAGVAFLAFAWLAFAMSYALRMRELPRRTLIALAALPAVAYALALSNEWHGLIWSASRLTHASEFVGLELDFGPFFYLHVVYSYALIFTSTVIVAWELSRSGLYRRSLAAVIGAPLVVGALNLFYLSPYNPYPWFDPTVLGFAFASLLLDDGVIRIGLFDAVPTLRSRVVELLSDGVVIVDRNGRILDINPAGAAVLGLALDATLARPISEHLGHSPMLPRLLSGAPGRISRGSAYYDVKPTILATEADTPTEIALVFRDVTGEHKNALDLEAAKAKFERQAHYDELTKLANRRMFMSRLKEEIDRVHRSGLPLSLLLFDLDHFKKINDTYGHDIGDRALSVVGSVTRAFKRSADVAARLGGEEFALLLPDTDQAGAIKVAQRLRSTIEATRIEDRNGNGIRVTASVGVATLSHGDSSLDQVLNIADRALYRAKHAGRNRVCTPD